MLPISLKRIFWDTDLANIDREANKSYVLSRILELGDEAAVKWLEHSYSLSDIINSVKTSRSLSPKSRQYWKLKYHCH